MDFDGLFFRADALASGITDGQLRRARLRDELIAVRPGAYVTAEYFATLDSEQQHLLLARAMAAEFPLVLSHVSAAIAWGMDVWGLPLAHVHSTTGRSITSKTGRRRTVHGTALLPSEHTVHQGFSLTTPARTVVDIARSSEFEQAVCVGDSALRRGLVTFDELYDAVESARCRSGAPKAVAAVGAMADRSESVGESRSRLLLVSAGITPLLGQSVFAPDGIFLGRVDELFENPYAIGEFDGSGKYGEDPPTVRSAILAEKYREDRMRDQGWVFTRWGWNDLSQPGLVVDRVRQALDRASRLPRPSGFFREDPLPSVD